MGRKTKRRRRKNKKRTRKRKKRRTKKKKSMKATIGILTVPLSPNKKFFSVCGDSYISESHIGWLKRNGINVVAIPFTTKKHKLYLYKLLVFPIYLAGMALLGLSFNIQNLSKRSSNLGVLSGAIILSKLE